MDNLTFSMEASLDPYKPVECIYFEIIRVDYEIGWTYYIKWKWRRVMAAFPRINKEHYNHYPIYQKVVDFTYGKNLAGCGRLDN